MNEQIINTPCYFDGQTYHHNGPYRLLIQDASLQSIQQQVPGSAALPDAFSQAETLDVEFLMPGLVEAHCHLFLDGGELDPRTRNTYLETPRENMLQTARGNIEASQAAGITLIRDAGDRYGINHAVRSDASANNGVTVIRSPGFALRRSNRYGGFLAREVTESKEIRSAIAEAAKSADDLKIILTDIVDFEVGAVTKPPQFALGDLELMVSLAAESELKTFVHCSGVDGLEIAVEAGVDSIEHGYFMNEAILDVMAAKDISWVPTISPVHFQWARPDVAGWSERAVGNLRRILDDHLRHIEIAYRKGVRLLAGSDAGSHGVRHGTGLIDELNFFLEAGLPMGEVLESATTRPRRAWGCRPANIAPHNELDVVILGSSPFANSEALRDVRMVLNRGSSASVKPSTPPSVPEQVGETGQNRAVRDSADTNTRT